MKNLVIVPLADNEDVRLPKFNVEFKKIHTKDCYQKYQHIFWSEVGKYLTFIHEFNLTQRIISEEKRQRTYCVVQNRRFFTNLDQLKVYSENEVVLTTPEWLGGFPLIKQFELCHPKYFYIFNDICKKLKFREELMQASSFSPHNIFCSKLNFFIQYAQFLEDTLTPYFDEKIDEKAGAWCAERLLFLFANQYFKVRIESFTILPKILTLKRTG